MSQFVLTHLFDWDHRRESKLVCFSHPFQLLLSKKSLGESRTQHSVSLTSFCVQIHFYNLLDVSLIHFQMRAAFTDNTFPGFFIRKMLFLNLPFARCFLFSFFVVSVYCLFVVSSFPFLSYLLFARLSSLSF